MPIFDDELRDMTSTAVPAIQDAYPVDDVVTEFPYGASKTYRTDIAGVDVDPERLRERATRLDRPIREDGTVAWTPLTSGPYKMRFLKPYLWVRELAAELEEQGDPLTRDAWRENCRWSSWEALWNWLVAKNFVQADEQGTDEFGFIRQEAVVVDVPLSGDQWAFELKPRDWRHAFRQAHRATHGRESLPLYRACPRRRNAADSWADAAPENVPAAGYADFAVVVMDAAHVEGAEANADVFRRAGVGLAALDRDHLRKVVHPRRQDPPDYSTTRLHLNERTLPETIDA